MAADCMPCSPTSVQSYKPPHIQLYLCFRPAPAALPAGAVFFVLCFFAFTSLTTVDLFMLERKMVVREVRGE